MTPVPQSRFGAEGDCFDACLATLLDMPLNRVNYFRGEDTWYADLQVWLAPMGLAYVEVDCAKSNPLYRFPLPVLAIAGGPSSRGYQHAIVVELRGWERKMIHDPHPSGDGLLRLASLGFLVRTNL